ncbi:hypothetical protein [Aeromonas caviae]
MGHIIAFLPARAGLRHPSASRTGAPTVQDDLTVSLIPSAYLRGIA